MTNEQKVEQAIRLLSEVYEHSCGDLSSAIEGADSALFDVLAILKGIA
jgi:hypothetical protein